MSDQIRGANLPAQNSAKAPEKKDREIKDKDLGSTQKATISTSTDGKTGTVKLAMGDKAVTFNFNLKENQQLKASLDKCKNFTEVATVLAEKMGVSVNSLNGLTSILNKMGVAGVTIKEGQVESLVDSMGETKPVSTQLASFLAASIKSNGKGVSSEGTVKAFSKIYNPLSMKLFAECFKLISETKSEATKQFVEWVKKDHEGRMKSLEELKKKDELKQGENKAQMNALERLLVSASPEELKKLMALLGSLAKEVGNLSANLVSDKKSTQANLQNGNKEYDQYAKSFLNITFKP